MVRDDKYGANVRRASGCAAKVKFYTNDFAHPVDIGCIIVRDIQLDGGSRSLAQRFTRKEAGRILGVEPNRLRYWERLQLVRPQARWGERFYSFSDLLALRTVQQLTARRIPARRVRRAVRLIERQFGEAPLALQELQFVPQGRDVLVVPPGANRPFSPIKQQWAFPFETAKSAEVDAARKIHVMAGPTAEDLFQSALNCEMSPDLLPQAVENYRHAIDLAPHWVDAHINLGVALYQLGRTEEARAEFFAAVQLDPLNGISRYNLGCVLEEQGELEQAINHLRRAARAMPAHADVHFNLALAYEKHGERQQAREEWTAYLRHAPNGPWAEQARVHLRKCSLRRKRNVLIKFPRKA